MKAYHWDIFAKTKPDNLDQIVKTLLSNRNLTAESEIKDFFSPPDPLDVTPEEVEISPKEIRTSIARIDEAIKKREKIIVYGDYDADGICATAIVWETLRDLGANALPYIPDRISEGYGLNEESITKLKKDDPDLKLIITVDHGIVGHKKIDLADQIGVDVIVSDHHQPLGTKPKALAVVHTTTLSGSGVAWILAKELLKFMNHKSNIINQLELVALGTIADLIPLTGVNRSIVKAGLNQIEKTKRPGLKALMEVARIDPGKIGTYEVGYILTPRLNAMGRLEHAIESLRLLCTHDSDRARKLAAILDKTNKDRQQLTQETVLHARQLLLTKQNGKPTSLIFISDECYEQGVIGLVAGKLVEEFYRPAIVVSIGEKFSKASARSISGFNIIETIREASDLLIDAGGHPMAAGFTVETAKLDLLAKRLEQLTNDKLSNNLSQRPLKVDLELDPGLVNEQLAQRLKDFEPFGQGNPEPLFVSRQVKIISLRTVGAESQHLKLSFQVPTRKYPLEAIAFRLGELQTELSPDTPIDIAYNVTQEEWNGNKRLQLRVKDIHLPQK